MTEIISSTNIHSEIIPRYDFNYQITINVIKEVSRYDRLKNIRYYNELYVLEIKKIVKRERRIRWLIGDKIELIFTTKLNASDKQNNKSNIIKFALEHIEKIESSIYS